MTADEGAEEVLAENPPAERDGESRPAADIRRSPRLGRRLDTWGWVALLVGAASFGVGSGGGSSEVPIWAGVVQTVAGLVFLLFGLWAVLRARRHLSWVLPDLDAVAGGEGVVLFLRAFSDERGFARKVASRPLRWFVFPPPVRPSELRTEEEQVARAVAPFGRMVALGPTSDRLPRAGANRSYASDDEWQSEVLAALDKADLVLLAAGPGDQLQWEVEQAVHCDDPARLVLVLPRTRGQYADFRETVGDLFPKGLPEAPEVRASRVRYVRAVVWFEPDWTPHLELLAGRLPLLRFAGRTQRALPRALRHVYERAGARTPVPDRTTRPRPRAVTASVALFSAFWLGVEALLFFVTFAAPYVLAALFGGQVSISSSHPADLPVVVLVSVVLFTAPLVVWMGRVLRAGSLAVLMLQILGLTSGVGVVAVAIRLMFSGVAVFEMIGSFVAVPLMVCAALLFLPAVLLMRRDARDWVDSRT